MKRVTKVRVWQGVEAPLCMQSAPTEGGCQQHQLGDAGVMYSSGHVGQVIPIPSGIRQSFNATTAFREEKT